MGEHQALQQAVGRQPVGTMQPSVCHFARREQARNACSAIQVSLQTVLLERYVSRTFQEATKQNSFHSVSVEGIELLQASQDKGRLNI